MNKQNNLIKGILFALITSIISGIAIFYSKISVAKIDPLVMATARNFYVSTVFLLLILVAARKKILKEINRKNIIQLLLIGIIGGGVPFYLFFSGLKLIGPQTGNLIHKTLFIWVAILSIIFLKEKLNLIYILSYILITFGTFFFMPINLVFGKGEFFVLSATVLWAVENIIAKKILKNISSDIVGFFRMGVGSIVLLSLTFITGKHHLLFSLNQTQLTSIFIGATILCFYVFFWYRALKYTPASLATLVLSFSVVIGNILNSNFAGIKLTQNDIYSTVIIGVGVLIIYLKIFMGFILNFQKYNG